MIQLSIIIVDSDTDDDSKNMLLIMIILDCGWPTGEAVCRSAGPPSLPRLVLRFLPLCILDSFLRYNPARCSLRHGEFNSIIVCVFPATQSWSCYRYQCICMTKVRIQPSINPYLPFRQSFVCGFVPRWEIAFGSRGHIKDCKSWVCAQLKLWRVLLTFASSLLQRNELNLELSEL